MILNAGSIVETVAPADSNTRTSTDSAAASPSAAQYVPRNVRVASAGSAKLLSGCTLATCTADGITAARSADGEAPLQWNTIFPGFSNPLAASDLPHATIRSSGGVSIHTSAPLIDAGTLTARPLPMKVTASSASACV